MEGPDRRRFDAFISYGHTADGKLAPALQTGLQRFGRRWRQRRALRVFRDDTGLAVNPDLWGSIQVALDDAEWLILLASPQAAASVWVNQELRHWLATRPSGRILPVLTEGTLVWDSALGAFDPERSTALPEALRGYFEAEPRHLDLTWARDETQLDLRHARFRDAIADLAAPIHGIEKDELESEDVRQHRRAARARRTGVAALVALLLVACTATVLAVGQRNRARHQTLVADSQKLAVQAQTLTASKLDLALLVAVAGFGLDDSVESRQGLLSALSAEPQLEAFDHRFGTALGTMAMSPDRRSFVVGGQDGKLRTWDGARAIGRPVAAGVGALLDAAYTPDGRHLLVSGDQGARLLDSGLRPAGPRLATRGAPEWVAVSPDGRLLATSSSRGFVQLWRARDGGAVSPPVRVSPVRATGLTFDRSGERLWVGTYERTVVSLDPGTGHHIGRPLRLPGRGSTYDVVLSPDGLTLAASVEDGSVDLLDARTGKLRRPPLEFHRSEPYEMAFNPSGSLLASVDTGGSIAVWRTRAGDQPAFKLQGHGELVSRLAFTSSRRLISVAGGELARWNLDGEPLGWRMSTHSGPLRAVARRPRSSDFVVVGEDTGRLTSWTGDGRDQRHPPVATGMVRVRAASWTPDGRTLLVGGARTVSGGRARGGRVVMFSGSDRAQRATLAIGSPAVLSLDVSPNGRLLAIGDNTGRATLWDLRTSQRVGPALAADSDGTGANTVAFSPDSRMLATGGNSGHVVAWRVRDGTRVWDHFTGGNVESVRWGLGGDSVIAGGGLSELQRLRADNGRVIGAPTATGVAEINATAVSSDGRLAAVTGRTGQVAVVDLRSGRRLYLLEGRPSLQSELAFLAGDHELVSVGDDGDVVLRHLDPSWWKQQACASAARPLTGEEARTYLAGLDADVCG